MNAKPITQHYCNVIYPKVTAWEQGEVSQDQEIIEAMEIAKFNRWMDHIGETIAVVTAFIFFAVVYVQLAIKFGWWVR